MMKRLPPVNGDGGVEGGLQRGNDDMDTIDDCVHCLLKYLLHSQTNPIALKILIIVCIRATY